MEYAADKSLKQQEVKKILDNEKIEIVNLNVSDRKILFRSKTIDEQKEKKLRQSLGSELKTQITTLRFDTVGPIIGKETVKKTVWAALIGVVAILAYMSFAFKGFNFAASAILALIHDLLVLVGVYSLVSIFFGAEIDTLFVTAALTTMSFSVHDTIVIFDKIREYVKAEGTRNIESLANRALTQTMVRSLNNSMTIVFMLLALILLGGTTIKFFIVALLIGTITGTYSSPFIATPILVWLEKRKK